MALNKNFLVRAWS